MAVELRAGVGQGRPNHREDVALVQLLLNGALNGSLATDGVWGTNTATALKTFQIAQFGFSDGFADPGDITFKRLRGNTQPAEQDALLRYFVLQAVGEVTDDPGLDPIRSRPSADGLGVVTTWPYREGVLDIHSHPVFGTWEVRGEIHIKYSDLGDEGGSLGNPISGERNLEPGPGRVSWFEGGRIEWTPAQGAQAITL